MNDEPRDSDDDDGLPDSAVPPRNLDELRRYERKKDRVRREDREAKEFWRGVFESKVGRREMWKLVAGAFDGLKTVFAVGPTGFPDPLASWHHRGIQDIGLRLYHQWLVDCPDLVGLMRRENDPLLKKPKRQRQPDQPEFGFE